MIKILFAFIWLFIPLVSDAQKILEGIVIDKITREPIPFASISIPGTSKGTSSNSSGQFSISYADVLEIKVSCIGFETRTIVLSKTQHIIELQPSTTLLNEVTIYSKELNAREIVKAAFKNIPINYQQTDFVQKFFYRHYCKDDSVYGRVIEAAAEILKKKGYKSQQNSADDKQEIRITQLRRSYDRTQQAETHVPISLNTLLSSDLVDYQQGHKKSSLQFYYNGVSSLSKNNDQFDFELKEATTLDGKRVYKIDYAQVEDPLKSERLKNILSNTGTVYITADTYAIVRAESKRVVLGDTIITSVSYRLFEDKYYPYHLVQDGHRNSRNKPKHWHHLELMSTEIFNKEFESFKGNEPGARELAQIPYDSVFWSTYAILKTTPLEDVIIADLGGQQNLKRQFELYQQLEADRIKKGYAGEEALSNFIELSKGHSILYIDFWASWCAPCIEEFDYERTLLKEFKNEITFVLVSLDADERRWKKAIEKYGLDTQGFVNFWVGDESEINQKFEITSIPRYILIDREGSYFDLHAKRPSDDKIKADFYELIKK